MSHGVVTIQRRTVRPFAAFTDRLDAGARLAQAFFRSPEPEAMVLAVPRGGVLVGAPLARALGAQLTTALVRKLPVPFSPEAGFGAVALDGQVVLNEPLVRELKLLPSQIKDIVREVLPELKRRAKSYQGHHRPPEVQGRHVYLVDDGLASGFTVLAAAQMARRQSPARMTLAVPVAHAGAIERVKAEFDDLFCLIAQEQPPFAVASYYEDFSELSDEEVCRCLQVIQ